MKCDKRGHEIKRNLKIKELNIEVTPIQDWDKSYKAIKIPKGFRLIKPWELLWIFDSEYLDTFLGDYKDKYNLFWCEQNSFDKEYNLSHGVARYNSGNWGADWDNLEVSYCGGRVVFVKENKLK